jgi:hypothetical protein
MREIQHIDPTTMSNTHYQLLIGSILGDSYITHYSSVGAYCLREMHALDEADYVFWKARQLSQYNPTTIQSKNRKKHGKNWQDQVGFNINGGPMLTQLRENFYGPAPNAQKLIDTKSKRKPYYTKNKLPWLWVSKLDLYGLLIWYLDDGTVNHSWSRLKSGEVTYSTARPRIAVNSFDTNDLVTLVEHLNTTFDLELSVKEEPNGNKIIQLNARSRDILFPIWEKYFEQHGIPECMRRKISLYRIT